VDGEPVNEVNGGETEANVRCLTQRTTEGTEEAKNGENAVKNGELEMDGISFGVALSMFFRVVRFLWALCARRVSVHSVFRCFVGRRKSICKEALERAKWLIWPWNLQRASRSRCRARTKTS
jgi:hypothetical protein